MQTIRTIFVSVALLAVAGCASHQPALDVLPQAPAVRVPSQPATTKDGTIRFTIAVPHPAARRDDPHYIPNKTKSLKVAAYSSTGSSIGTPVVVQLTTKNKNCKQSTAALNCTVSARFPSGNDQIVVTLYQTTNGKGAALASGKTSVKLPAFKTKTLRLTLDGIPSVLQTSTQAMSLVDDGTTHVGSFTVTVYDASYEMIVGRFAKPLDVSVSGGYRTGITVSPAKLTSSSQQTVTVSYDSSVAATPTDIFISAQGVSAAQVAFVPFVVKPGSLDGFLNGGQQTITVSESGQSTPFAVSGGGLKATCSPSTCAPSSTGGKVSITVSPQTSTKGTLSISDVYGTAAQLPYVVSTYTNYPSVAAQGTVSNIMNGGDGNLYAIVQSGGNGEVAQITTSGNVAATYPLPSPFNPASSPSGVAGGDNGLWLVDRTSKAIFRMSTASGSLGAFTSYNTTDGAAPMAIALGPDGQALWFVDSNGNAGTVIESDGLITPITTPYYSYGAGTSIAVDPVSGDMYFTSAVGIILKVSGSAISQIPPLENSQGALLPAGLVVVGPDHNLWVALGYQYSSYVAAGDVCAQTTTGKELACYATPLVNGIDSLIVGPDGAFWMTGKTASNAYALVRMTITGAITKFSPPDCCATANDLVTGPDGALWISTSKGGVDRMQL